MALKCCDKCGKQVATDKIHLYQDVEGKRMSISWICEGCWRGLNE